MKAGLSWAAQCRGALRAHLSRFCVRGVCAREESLLRVFPVWCDSLVARYLCGGVLSRHIIFSTTEQPGERDYERPHRHRRTTRARLGGPIPPAVTQQAVSGLSLVSVETTAPPPGRESRAPFDHVHTHAHARTQRTAGCAPLSYAPDVACRSTSCRLMPARAYTLFVAAAIEAVTTASAACSIRHTCACA